MATQKKSYAARLGALAVALSLVTACLLGGTMAKYVTEVTGTGSATVAAWSFKANEKTDTFTVDLAKTAYTNINNTGGNKIAPGTEGSFDIKLDASGSDVAVDYTIAFSNLQNKPTNLKFYSDENMATEIADLTNTTALNGEIKLADISKPVTKTIYWEWAYEIGNDEATKKTNNAQDVKDAVNSMTFDITVIGTQQTPATPTA